MARRTLAAIFCLALGQARAGVLDGGWTHDLDLSTGFGSSTVTVALSETTAVGLFDGRLRLGIGPRLFGYFGGSDLSFSAGPNTLVASQVRNYALNVAVSARLRIVAGLEIGANIDVIGVGFGATRTGTYSGTGAPSSQEASPPTFNLLAMGSGDRGTLASEFFAAWWFDDRWAIRAGASHVGTELEPAQPLTDERLRHSSTQFFAAVSYRF